MRDYPQSLAIPDHVEPAPRRIRAFLAGEQVLDTTRARYVWEHARYPQYYVPWADVRGDLLVADGAPHPSSRGSVQSYTLQVGDINRRGATRRLTDSPIGDLVDTVRFDWAALDAWFEEDERVYVHARNPYARIDVLRSTRAVRVELDGAVLAESSSPVMLFETGLPTRYYLNRTDVDFTHLVPTDTVTECPYKGVTSGYWSARIGDAQHADIAWTYAFPTREALPIAGLIAFFNERVDVYLDGALLERPETPFS